MDDTSKTLKPWVTFAGCVPVVVVLYLAQTVFVPFALAILLTFVLTPPVTWLERWVGALPVLVVATAALLIGLARTPATAHVDRRRGPGLWASPVAPGEVPFPRARDSRRPATQ